MQLNSGASIDVDGCSVHVNSTDSAALSIKSNASVTADAVCVRGGYLDQSTEDINPTPDTNCARLNDPFADLPAPDTSGCYRTNYTLSGSDTDTLSPGVYCGGITIDSNASVTFLSGTYVIKDGGFDANSNASMAGSEVFFYLTGDDAQIKLDSNTTVDFTAPNSGDYAGMLFFQDRNFGGVHSIDSNSNKNFTGIIYLHNGTLLSDSNSSLGGPSNCFMVVVNNAEFNSNAGFITTPDLDNCPFEVPDDLFLMRLVLRG